MRIATACLECRTNKRKCAILRRDDACLHCIRRGVRCSLSKTRISETPTPRRNVPVAQSPQDKSPQLSHDVDLCQLYGEDFVKNLFQTYLYLIHDRPHSLFHVPTLWQALSAGTLQPSLILSLCAVGSRLSNDPIATALASQLTAWAKKSINAQIDNISIQTIQSCILLANLCVADLEPGLESLYFGVASRMAQILRLNQPQSNDSTVLRETKSRVWWTLVTADYWCSAGLGIPRQLYTQRQCVDLPYDEYEFQQLSANDESKSRFSTTRPGLWAYMIHLVRIFGLVNDLHHQILEEGLEESVISGQVRDFAERLEEWDHTLPIHLRLNNENLAEHRHRGLGGPFVAMHLGFFHYSTLLYFRYLDKDGPQQDPLHEEYARRCRQLASAYSNLLARSRSMPGYEAVYATVGHMTVVSSSVLLHTLLFGDECDLPETRANLTSNFAALMELKKYWPCLERTMTRLLDFQESCLSAAQTETHRIDEWMVRFLTEHSMPLDRRLDYLQRLKHRRNEPPMETNGVLARETMATQALASLWGSPGSSVSAGS